MSDRTKLENIWAKFFTSLGFFWEYKSPNFVISFGDTKVSIQVADEYNYSQLTRYVDKKSMQNNTIIVGATLWDTVCNSTNHSSVVIGDIYHESNYNDDEETYVHNEARLIKYHDNWIIFYEENSWIFQSLCGIDGTDIYKYNWTECNETAKMIWCNVKNNILV